MTQPDVGSLQHERSVLERERASIVDHIHDLRARARQKSLEAAATRTPISRSEIDFWQTGIAKAQAELMATQAKIKEVNKRIRASTEALASEAPPPVTRMTHSTVRRSSHDDFLACFHTIAKDSLDPRQFEALESGARSLLRDYQQMNQP